MKVFYNKKFIFSIAIVFALCVFGYYNNIPKVSDVERFQKEQNISALCNLLDKTFEYKDEYSEVRSSAIKALANANTPESREYLEKCITENDNIGEDVRKEIVDELVEKDGQYLDMVAQKLLKDTTQTNNFSEREIIYYKLLRFATDDDKREFLGNKIAVEAVKHMKNSYDDKEEANFLLNRVLNNGKTKTLLAKYVELLEKLNNFDDKRKKAIDYNIRKVIDEGIEIENYFNYAGEDIRSRTQQIYLTEGIDGALRYQSEVTKEGTKKLQRYYELRAELDKLINERNNLDREKENLEKQKDYTFNQLKESVVNESNLPVNALGLNWTDSSEYISSLEFIVRGDNGDNVYTASNIDSLNLSDFLPNDISIINNRFILSKNSEKLIEVSLEVNALKFSSVFIYLNDKYGEPCKAEASKERYYNEWRGNQKVLQLIYNKRGDSNAVIRCVDRATFEQRP